MQTGVEATVRTPGVRPATSADLPAIHRLLQDSSLPTSGVDARALSGFLVAEHDGAVVGVVGLETCCDRYALLRSTAVADAWRGRGVGRRLVERAIAQAEASGREALYLLTTTAESYFPSFGFAPIDRAAVPAEIQRTEEFTSSCPASAVVMTRRLACC